MFLRIVFLNFIFFVSSFLFGQTTDLLISEYVEGGGNEKYIELYNGTGASVDLSDYQLRLYANGAVVGSPTNNVTLSGTLADNSVIVYQNSAAALYSGVNNAAVNFNGDDAVALYKISTASFVDIFGNIGCDPGSAWTNTNTTLNKTLVRNANICSGITLDDVTNCPFDSLSSQWTQYNQDDVSNLGSHTNTCTSCTDVTPTVNASGYTFTLIGCNGITINWTSPAANDGSLVVIKAGSDVTTDPSDGTTYSANNTFGSGTDIGTNEYVVYNGSDTSVSINGLSASTTYFVNIFEYNGTGSCIKYRTSDEVSSSESTIACTDCPYLTTVLVNSCDNAPCTEGDNEMFFFNSMDYYVSTAAADITVNYGSSSPASTTYADSFTANSAAIDSMNADVGCGTTFIDASTVSYIPANSSFLILNETVCADAFDWASICSMVSDNVYVLFSDDATWNSTGQFSNSPGDPGRYFKTEFEGSCSTDYNYNSSLPSGDGAYATWNNAGGTASFYGSDGCALPVGILPVKLLYFKGKKVTNGNLLEWATTTEINNDYFTLERAEDGINFTEIGIINGSGNSYINQYYQFTDDGVTNHVNYYRLKQTDFNNQYSYSKTIALSNDLSDIIYYDNTSKKLKIGDIKNGIVSIYTLQGKKVKSVQTANKEVTLVIAKGMYLITIQTENQIYSKKIIVR